MGRFLLGKLLWIGRDECFQKLRSFLWIDMVAFLFFPGKLGRGAGILSIP